MSKMNVARCLGESTLSRAWIAVIIAVSAAGCADPEGAYDDFVDRFDRLNPTVPDTGGPESGDACPLATQTDLEGQYFVTLSPKVAPTLPIVFIGTVIVDESASPPTMKFVLQPLNAKDKKTPAGSTVESVPSPVESDGSFTAEFGNIVVDGAANPISGSELETTATMAGVAGSLCSPADFPCGIFDGQTSRPVKLDLNGSTFTFQRITDPANLPKPVLKCEDKP